MKILFSVLLLVSLISCSSDEPEPANNEVTISATEYSQASSEGLDIVSAVILGDMLKVKVHAGGCDGSTWVLKLIDSGSIAESYPVQRNLKFDFENSEECKKLIIKEYEFSLVPIRVENAVILHLEGWDEDLLYEF